MSPFPMIMAFESTLSMVGCMIAALRKASG